MANSKDDRAPGEGPKPPAKPLVPPFRGPVGGSPSPLRPADANARGTRPPFVPPVVPGKRAGPAGPPPSASVAKPAGASPQAVPPAATPMVRPMSSSTATPALAELPAKSSAKATPPQTVLPSGRATTPPRPALAYEPPVAAPSLAYEPPSVKAGASPGGSTPESLDRATRAGEVIDPAPFVGTRESGPVSTIRRTSELPFLSIATPPSTPVVPATGALTVALAEVVRRIEKGELKVTGYREGMSAEATLVAVLAAMLTRER